MFKRKKNLENLFSRNFKFFSTNCALTFTFVTRLIIRPGILKFLPNIYCYVLTKTICENCYTRLGLFRKKLYNNIMHCKWLVNRVNYVHAHIVIQ